MLLKFHLADPMHKSVRKYCLKFKLESIFTECIKHYICDETWSTHKNRSDIQEWIFRNTEIEQYTCKKKTEMHF